MFPVNAITDGRNGKVDKNDLRGLVFFLNFYNLREGLKNIHWVKV